MPLISVIIPLYNKEKFIANSLRSALAQTFSDFEVLVIDDGSTDGSTEIVKEFIDERIRFISKKNEGVSATRNLGIEKASGKYIAFLDADDIWKVDFLEEMNSLIASFPEQKVFSAAIEVESSGKIFPAVYSISKAKNPQIINYFEGSWNQSAIFTSSAIFEKSVFEKIGNFDVALKTEEDIDLWIRIGLHYPIVFSWKIGARYSYDSLGLSKNQENFSKKTDFSNYLELEGTNLELRKFLSIHRFSMALKSKILNQRKDFIRFYKLIHLEDLTWKQKVLLSLPPSILKILTHTKQFLQHYNIRLSAFK